MAAVSPHRLEAPWWQVARAERTWAIPIPIVLGGIIVLALSLRLVAALLLTPHVDEAASLLAAAMVVERGLPILPSGTVYFQGGTLSYLLAPFVALGADSLEFLQPLRLLCVIAGTATVPLAYGLARAIGARERTATFAALLVAIDPLAVQWSAHLRMYALLQPLALIFAWLVVSLATGRVTLRGLVGLVVTAWALTFTQVAALALWPGAALALWWAHRRSPRPITLRLLAAGCLSGLAPLTLLALNRLLGSASVQTGDGSSEMGASFVGDSLIASPQPNVSGEVTLSSETIDAFIPDLDTFVWLAPQVIMLTAALIAAWRVLRPRSGPVRNQRVRSGLAVLLAIGALPPAVVWLGATVPRARYLLHVHALAWIVLAVLLTGALGRAAAWLRGGRPGLSRRDAALLLIAPLILAGGLGWRLLLNPVVHPDYGAALSFVADVRAPHEPIIVARPAIAALTPGTGDNLYFLAGSPERPDTERLTRRSENGELIDYWIGAPAISSAEELARMLAQHPDAWIVVDQARLEADWAYAGAIADLLQHQTVAVYEGAGDVLVLRSRATAPLRPAAIGTEAPA